MTTTLANTNANAANRQRAEVAWEELRKVALRRGYHGTVAVEASIQDGTIQHIRSRSERIEK